MDRFLETSTVVGKPQLLFQLDRLPLNDTMTGTRQSKSIFTFTQFYSFKIITFLRKRDIFFPLRQVTVLKR